LERTTLVRLAWAIRIVWIFCLAAGTYNHSLILIHHGWDWRYGGMPIGAVIFWTSLTLLDPLVAILLFLKPKLAAIMLMILMAGDVANNTGVILKYGGGGLDGGKPMDLLGIRPDHYRLRLACHIGAKSLTGLRRTRAKFCASGPSQEYRCN
jgi:hypothetical protein